VVRRNAAERAHSGEEPGEGEEDPGLDEAGSGAASLICSTTPGALRYVSKLARRVP
jgi:hypothetical protein